MWARQQQIGGVDLSLGTIVSKKGSYSLGILYLYPGGLGPIKFDDVEVSEIQAPAEINQLYYIRAIDTADAKGAGSAKIEGAAQPDGSWKNATGRFLNARAISSNPPIPDALSVAPW